MEEKKNTESLKTNDTSLPLSNTTLEATIFTPPVVSNLPPQPISIGKVQSINYIY
ncbi:hypothetical protein [Clostridium sp.]|uniref:hypothetical protein n=1 Tax=Clostridium sp. TaxID=1506 RepID=UPI002841AE9E|nr:hypothetical protein [Clostridium sp.]MDR3597214.1 hypothetical protein [Clostridium sp.]